MWMNGLKNAVEEMLNELWRKRERVCYEKENHNCGGSCRCNFGGDCDCFCFGADTSIDLTNERYASCLYKLSEMILQK